MPLAITVVGDPTRVDGVLFVNGKTFERATLAFTIGPQFNPTLTVTADLSPSGRVLGVDAYGFVATLTRINPFTAQR